jgi:ABC-type glycerol-3-phosphate transport system permease component
MIGFSASISVVVLASTLLVSYLIIRMVGTHVEVSEAPRQPPRPTRKPLGPLLLCGQVLILLVLTFRCCGWSRFRSRPTSRPSACRPSWPFTPTGENYVALFQGKFARSFGNGTVVSVVTT